MKGAKKVIFFCLMIAVVPMTLLMVSLHLRNNVFTDVKYPVAESDILEMVNGISSIFCQKHTLRMDSPFNAFQAKGRPVMSSKIKKHIRLKKSMSLPDDTLEYWGFFLPSSSAVYLSVCSRFDGSRILVVKGEKNLRNCGLNQPAKPSGHMAEDANIFVHYEQIHNENETIKESLTNNVTYDEDNTATEIIEDEEDESKSNNFTERRNILALKLSEDKPRQKRQIPANKLDGGIAHGGNAINYNDKLNDSGVSSFENSLLTCYDGQILLSESFHPSKQCNGTQYLETGKHLRTTHNVRSDGYYYYIFYSDNDYVLNDIYAIFDIYKPTYEYGNYTAGCINVTECSFPVEFWSNELVVVEVPMRDGIENENDDITVLTSVCHPRTAIYAIFPIMILVIIMICAFQ